MTNPTRDTAPGSNIKTITTGNGEIDDAADFSFGQCRGLYIGAAGALKFDDLSGNTITYGNAIAGYHPIEVRRVWSTGTDTAVKADIHAIL